MTILPRHKILWWQMLANCLPVRDGLAICFPIPDINCPICHYNVENILHLFVYCDLTRKLWLAFPWNLRLDSLELASPMHFLRFLWTMEAQDSRVARGNAGRSIFLFGSVLYDLLWKHKNDITHGGAPMDSALLFQNINHSYVSLLKSLTQPSHAVNSVWTPPPNGWVKINMDAAVGTSAAAISCVARDSRGSIISWNSKIILTYSPLIAEACAVEFVIDFATATGWTTINFSRDAKIILDALSSLKSNVFWFISSILDNCISKFKSIYFFGLTLKMKMRGLKKTLQDCTKHLQNWDNLWENMWNIESEAKGDQLPILKKLKVRPYY
ncbi:hypothetical protein UlMin_030910 [Ulmus minor]